MGWSIKSTLIPFLDTIEDNYFELPKSIVADAGYGSEQNYEDILGNRDRTPLITYNQYRREKKDSFQCPNDREVWFSYHSNRTDRYGVTRQFKVYECEDCLDCQTRTSCLGINEVSWNTFLYPLGLLSEFHSVHKTILLGWKV